MKTNKYLLDQIKHLKGRVIVIDAEDYLIDAIDKNDAITECFQLNTIDQKKHKIFGKKISSKKMKKIFKKKKIDVIILNNKALKPMLVTFIRDSIYISKGYIYIYGDEKEIPTELLIDRYNRYNTKVEKIDENGYILKIDSSKAKNNWFKDLGYLIMDNLVDFNDLLASYLTN